MRDTVSGLKSLQVCADFCHKARKHTRIGVRFSHFVAGAGNDGRPAVNDAGLWLAV